MFEIRFDMNEFEQLSQAWGTAAYDQVPFALSLSLNRAVEDAQTALIVDTWPRHVTVRNPSFLRATLRRKYSTKRDLEVKILDTLGRASLKLHAEGGVKRPRGAHLAIPPKGVRMTSHGLPKNQRPRALIARTPARSLRITPTGIFVGKRGGGLRLAFSLKSSANQPKDVPFHEDFELIMRNSVRTSFPAAMKRALATRRRS
jgi:hypothetical protein